MNIHIARALSALAIASTLGASAYVGVAVGHADPSSIINLTDLPDIDSTPTCELEDGSDSTVKPCVWTDTDTGDAYLTYADYSVLIVDDTVR